MKNQTLENMDQHNLISLDSVSTQTTQQYLLDTTLEDHTSGQT